MMLLTIPGRLPGLNEMIDAARISKYESAAQKKTYTELVAWCCKAARLPKMNRIALDIIWYEPNAKRDFDNIVAGCKFLLDGMVTARVIPNDGQKNVESIKNVVRVDKDNPRIEVEISKEG